MQILNRCRVYLQVMTLVDLMNGKGTGFTVLFKCEKDHQRHNSFKWLFQPEPTTSMKKAWSAALRKTFGLKAGVTSYTLGQWLHNDTTLWLWFFHPASSFLFQRFGAIWRVWKRESNRGRIGTTSKYKYFTQASKTYNCGNGITAEN